MSNVSCTVAWTDGAFYGLRIDRYRIEGRTDHNDTWRVLADRVVAEQIDFQVIFAIHSISLVNTCNTPLSLINA